jgi:hypothetical protein
MINYIEKGYSMHEWLASQGVQLIQRDNVWAANVPDEQVSQLIADYNPWPAEKSSKLKEINEAFEAAINQLTAGTTESERNSWAIQEKEAKAYPTETPEALMILAQSRGIPLEALVEKVLQKAALYQHYYFTIQGQRDKLEDQVKALPDSGSIERLPELWAIKFGG